MIRVCLKDPAQEIRASAAPALAAIDPDKDEVTAILLILLKDPSGMVRRAAAPEVGKLGPRASAAVPSLMAMLDKETEVSSRYPPLKKLAFMMCPAF